MALAWHGLARSAAAALALAAPGAGAVSYSPWATTTTEPPPQGYVCGHHGATVKHLVRRASIPEKEREVLPGIHHLEHEEAAQEEYSYDEPKRRVLPEWFDEHHLRRPRNESHDASAAKGLDPMLWSYPIGNYSYLDSTEDWRSAVDAVHCSGRSCQFLSVHFSKLRNLTTDVDHFTNWVGRRGRGKSEATCAEGRVVSGIQCYGDDCSSLRLTCGVPDAKWSVTRDNMEMGEFTSKCERDDYSTCGSLVNGAFRNYVMYGVSCTTPSCSHKKLLCKRIKDPVVDCQWGAWSLFGQCSATCGGGWMWRTRKPSEVGTWDGQKCTGPDKEREQCNAFSC
eukprot:SRR837773.6094.p1 GENE.SRR837773.6094~~SRR837773.6094.p1  ORF type:complete len:338 (+),score=85.88 SRR837773.6094:67-1080(+)